MIAIRSAVHGALVPRIGDLHDGCRAGTTLPEAVRFLGRLPGWAIVVGGRSPTERDGAGVAERKRRTKVEEPDREGEEEFLAAYDPSRFPSVAVTVDMVILTVRDGRLCVLMIRRGGHPFRGRWALPGGFVESEESTDVAARRELAEETGFEAGGHVELLRVYSDPWRDPRTRVISVAYLGLVPDVPVVVAGSDADESRLWPVAELTGRRAPALAFDHDRIIRDAVERARANLEYTTQAAELLPKRFTMADLRRVYAAVWGAEPPAARFRRQVLAVPGFVVPNRRGPAQPIHYRRGRATRLHPPILRPGV
jgi:8-oxo-dGTP diphosphatase